MNHCMDARRVAGKIIIILLLSCLTSPLPVFGGTDEPLKMEGARAEIYKTVDDVELRAWIFNPKEHSENDRRPAIVFFFGGGWTKGSPTHFRRHCEYLTSRGMVAVAADYRVRKRHNSTVKLSVADAKSVVRWLRKNADRLGIDPNRIAAGGGSAGGHLAAATATLPGHDDPIDDTSISARPNALILFNPALTFASIPGNFTYNTKEVMGVELPELLGAEPESLSPYHHIKEGIGPTIIFHGMADDLILFKTVELFTETMRAQGNRCELVGYKGVLHGFFNYGRGNNGAYIDTMHRMDKFLVSIGYLGAPPEPVVK